jgi:hypothetical protein
MHPKKKFAKRALLVVIGSSLLSLTRLAAAESDAVRAIYLSGANVPTNVAEINTYPEPPKMFNPLTASDAELATYGFPQRPDKQTDPDHYALWERAMKAAKIRWKGELKAFPSSGKKMAPTGLSPSPQASFQLQAGPLQLSNVSGAGVILNNGRTTWNSKGSYNDIWTIISVPRAQLPFGTSSCAASDYYYLSLAGIDGQVNDSVNDGVPSFFPGEMAGVFVDVVCGSQYAIYSAYVGWEDQEVLTFSVNPGDLFYTELHAFGGCNNGSAFVEDLTTLTYNSYTISNPCDMTPQVGRYANWVVARPLGASGIGLQGAWPLPNTIDIFFDGGAVANGAGTRFYPGSQAASTQILTMTDDAGDQPIELVHQGTAGSEGLHALRFETTGCAFTGGCTP